MKKFYQILDSFPKELNKYSAAFFAVVLYSSTSSATAQVRGGKSGDKPRDTTLRDNSTVAARPEQLKFPPLDYQPPVPEQFRVQLKSGPVAYVVPDRELPLAESYSKVPAGKMVLFALAVPRLLLKVNSNSLLVAASVTSLFFPEYWRVLSPVLLALGAGEIPIVVWLIGWGARVPARTQSPRPQ